MLPIAAAPPDLMTLAGAALVMFFVLWWAAVELFDIKPFIAPSPVAVLEVLYSRFGNLMDNLLPTAVEAVLGDYRGGPWDERADVWIMLARRL